MRHSLYWDDFNLRLHETANCLNNNLRVPVRRVAVFVTNKCNFKCQYCKHRKDNNTITKEIFSDIVKKYGKDAIIHITGGEPSCVEWLYDFIENNYGYRFNLNTNAYKKPPRNVNRMKISLDSYNARYFDKLVGVKGAFVKVVNNIIYATEYSTTSITMTITKENYKHILGFIEFCNVMFPKLYAIFFSVYKGTDPKFMIDEKIGSEFFRDIKPRMLEKLNDESKDLLVETLDEKRRLIEGVRFPENGYDKCYLSLSEKTIDYQGKEYTCSHLFRDKVFSTTDKKYPECKYGCNRKLVLFNQKVQELLK